MSFNKGPMAHTFDWPVDRGAEQYADYVAQALTAQKMHEFGIRVDRRRCMAHIVAATKRQKVFTDMFLDATGLERAQLGPSGAGQTDAVKAWFKAKGAPDVVFDKKTKEPQFNAAAFLCWATDFAGSPFSDAAAALLGMRAASTNRKFARAYYAVAGQYEGRIHFSFNVIGTKGTRWSSSGKFFWRTTAGEICNDGEGYSLNCQNIPKRATNHTFSNGETHALKASLRDCFIPDRGCVWASFDYEGAEARLIAYNSGDKALLSLIEEDLDIHTATARQMFLECRIPAEVRKIEKTMEMREDWVTLLPDAVYTGFGVEKGTKGLLSIWLRCRDVCKTSLYSGSYQAPSQNGDDKWPELYKTMKAAFPNMQETYFNVLMGRFFTYYSGIKGWQLEIVRQTKAGEPWVLPQTGKTLYTNTRARGANQRLNAYQQSGLGAIIAKAIPIVSNAMEWRQGALALLAMVHDELDLQIPENRVIEIEQFVASELARPMNFGGVVASIPAAGDIGSNWGDVKPLDKWIEAKTQLKEQT